MSRQPTTDLVLSALQTEGRALSAYEILGELREANPRIAPPTVYRALSALSEQGRVHRLESLNAFIACKCTHGSKSSIMSICGDCGSVEENDFPDVIENLSRQTATSGFVPVRHVVEVHGVCAACQG